MRSEYKKEVDKLHNLLWDAKRDMEEIPKYRDLVGSKNDIKNAEMLQTMRLCENDYLSVGELLNWLEYIKKPRMSHRLRLNKTGRFVAGGRELTCGRHIELFVLDGDDAGWNFGRVEHNSAEGYYFHNVSGMDDHRLKEGDIVAIR